MKETYNSIPIEDEGYLLSVPLYKKLLAEVLQIIEVLGLPENQEVQTKKLIKQRFYFFLNELGFQVDYKELIELIRSNKIKTNSVWSYEE